ncbi:hypothetical protein ACSQ67_014327 [Phaseolus vulgaris]
MVANNNVRVEPTEETRHGVKAPNCVSTTHTSAAVSPSCVLVVFLAVGGVASFKILFLKISSLQLSSRSPPRDHRSSSPSLHPCSSLVSDSLVNDVDMYEITTGFGGTSYRRTNQGVALQNELIRSFLNST